MNFGFNPPNPEDVKQAMEDLKDAFTRAAARTDTGSARPLFQNLSEQFAKTADKAIALQEQNPDMDPRQAMMQLMPGMMQMQMSLQRIETTARIEPGAAEALQELKADLQAALRPLLGQMPKPPQPPKPPKGSGPRDGGSFKL